MLTIGVYQVNYGMTYALKCEGVLYAVPYHTIEEYRLFYDSPSCFYGLPILTGPDHFYTYLGRSYRIK